MKKGDEVMVSDDGAVWVPDIFDHFDQETGRYHTLIFRGGWKLCRPMEEMIARVEKDYQQMNSRRGRK